MKAATPQNQTEIDAKQAELTELTKQKNRKEAERDKLKNQLSLQPDKSENFLADILSDADGVSFHRFQVVAWALVLGVVFVWGVLKDLAMPTFSEALLGLLGISAGTYLGLKIPEPTVKK